MDIIAILDRIEALLKKAGHSKAELYEACSVSASAVSQWKSGKTNPSTKSLQNIANYLNVSYEYLISGKDQDQIQNEHYASLNDLYYHGVQSWINKGFFTADEKTTLKAHFSGVLSRYKELIDKTSGIKRSLKIHLKAMVPLNSETNSMLSTQEIAEQFLKQELGREISALTSYINAFTFHFAHVVFEEDLAGQIPSEEMDRQREQWEVENYRKCLVSEQLQAEQQKKPIPVTEDELLELFKAYVERLSPGQLQMIFDQARSMWEQNKVHDQMQRMIARQKAPLSVSAQQTTDETS